MVRRIVLGLRQWWMVVIPLLLCVGLLVGQGIQYFQIDSAARQGAGAKFWMFNSGTSLPGSCSIGDMFFKTNETAGKNLYGCTAVNTWTLLGDGVGTPESIPTGTIAFFNLASCPSNWSEYTSLQGRYAVGKPSGGTLSATVGTALNNIENREHGKHGHTVNDQQHAHNITDDGHVHTETAPGGSGIGGVAGTGWGITYPSTVSATTDITIQNAYTNITGTNETGTTEGTNAPYIQLLACRHN